MTYLAEEHIRSRLGFTAAVAAEHFESDIELDSDSDTRLPRKGTARFDIRRINVDGVSHMPSHGSDGESTVASEELGFLRRPATPGSADADADADAATEFQGIASQLTVRLLFPPEDGGMLIGKDGCHINKLKASTTALWSIKGSNANQEDRVVVISGSAEGVVNAIQALTEHMDQQQQLTATLDSSRSASSPLTLRLLFPAGCIGFVMGPGGARVAKLRVDSKISRLHIYRDNISQADERVIEISGTKKALCQAVTLILRETGAVLAAQQSIATLYKPSRNGLRRLQSGDRAASSSELRADSYVPSSSKDHPRNRSQSLLGLGEADSSRDGADRPKQKRRMSDNSESDYWPSKRRVSEVSESGRSSNAAHHQGHTRRESPPQLKRRISRNPLVASNSGKRSIGENSKEEKLVIPDCVAGRLIGRKGSYLLSLETQSGAQITLSPRVPNMADRIVTVVGRIDDVNAACKLIKDSVQNFEDLEV
ncbi:Poly(rC)-binding protein 4 [Coemansia aciculifera]|uniref:Poly(RC)-binding protein 4 n=1 Tax=Coemansia aciculifera TaxID=417176 RepID=A0A9W8M3S8_9FUNG|nr:Poly(rC)-binding protein 4 [Coemansia aciculifera]